MSMKLMDVWEQNAVFDGEPDFMDGSLVMNVLNHNAYGGTRKDVENAAETGEMARPKLFRVRVTIEAEEI